MRTSRAKSEENSTRVQWLTANAPSPTLPKNSAILSLVASWKNEWDEKAGIEIKHSAGASAPFIPHLAQQFGAPLAQRRHRGAECGQVFSLSGCFGRKTA